MSQIFLTTAAISGGLSVAAGAFAAHALAKHLTRPMLEIFETAARYQMYHALVLVLVALLLSRALIPQPALVVAGWAFITGMVLFCGSLYALSLTNVHWLGAVTPVGGLAFLVGWGCLAIAAGGLK
ncbi:MAG TPA: DUF423 domain-containing protein [Candidatus Caenarcaniphilales bacterium]